jgi:hypothetical protein
MMPLFGMVGMIVYLAVLVLLGVNHWMIDLRGAMGHPTENELALLVLGMASSAVAGVLLHLLHRESELALELNTQLREFQRLVQYYDTADLLRMVENRLTEDANYWHAAMKKLAKERMYRSSDLCKSDTKKSQEIEKEIKKEIDFFCGRFMNIHDHATKLFGQQIQLKEKRIQNYVSEENAA